MPSVLAVVSESVPSDNAIFEFTENDSLNLLSLVISNFN